MAERTPSDILNLPLEENDANAATVREYLAALVRVAWFDMKRPFGNSGWQDSIYIPLMKAGLVDGSLDEDGYIEAFDETEADALVLAAIEALGKGDS